MPMVAMVAIDLLDMAVLRLTLAPSQHHSPVGQEHGRTIPLTDIREALRRLALFLASPDHVAAGHHRQATCRSAWRSD